MEIESLKCFVVLSDKKRFTEAAYECNMSQSTLSKKIKKMEKRYSMPDIEDADFEELPPDDDSSKT